MNPQISIVIPLYNKADYILNALQSALSQGSAVLEVVVIDDGSTDSGPQRVEDLADPRVRLIRKENGGVSSARNRGIEEARGEYITFLDADDIYLDGFVAEILQLIKRFPNAQMYATSFCKRWPDGRDVPIYLRYPLDPTKAQIVENIFSVWSYGSIFIHISSICVRRSTFFQKNIFFPVGENVGEDHDVIFRLAETGEIAFSPKPLMAYSQQVAGSLFSSRPDYPLPSYTRLSQRAKTREYPRKLRAAAYQTVSVAYLTPARVLISKGRRLEAANLIFQRRSMGRPLVWSVTLILLLLPNRLMQSQWLKRIWQFRRRLFFER
jgi:glycosyltransferase involved in cell wall biosynthesis